MHNFIKKLALFLVAGLWAASSPAFSLMGPFAAWETQALGYGTPGGGTYFWGGPDVGAPQYPGNQYRWNVPRIYYAYDASFVTYFGEAGVNAIEQAIAVFNAIPPVSQMSTNLTEFPLDSRRINYTAAALGLLDLKSTAMSEIISQLGTSDPSRYVWSLRARVLPGGLNCPEYLYNIGMFNYDPVTWNVSTYVNNVLYTWGVESSCNPDQDTTFPQLVNPTSIGGSAVAEEYVQVLSESNPGSYFTGLTRDDAGALRYLLSSHQVAVESLPGGAVLGSGVGGLPVVAGATQNGSPWNLLVAISLTNATVLGNNGSPWTIISFNNATNATNSTVTGATTTTTASTNVVYNLAGIEKLTFVQVGFDSTIGVNFTPFQDSYSVTAYVDGHPTSVAVTRPVLEPDFLFATFGDEVITGNITGIISRPEANYKNTAGFIGNNGPGSILPSVVAAGGLLTNSVPILFSEESPFTYTTEPIAFLTPGTSSPVITYYGSFDGSTNAPVIYPSGTSVQAIEGILFP